MAVPEPVLTARDLHRPGALGTEFTHELEIRACPLLRGECGSRLTDWHLPCPPSRALRVSPATRARGARLSQLHSCAVHRVCWSWRDRQSPRPGVEDWPEAWTRGTGVFPGRVRARRRDAAVSGCWRGRADRFRQSRGRFPSATRHPVLAEAWGSVSTSGSSLGRCVLSRPVLQAPLPLRAGGSPGRGSPRGGTLGAGRSAHGPRVGEPRGVRSSSTLAGEGCDLRRPRQGPWSPRH